MATQQDVFQELQKIKEKIIEKGGSISQTNINVSLPELTAGVESIPVGGGGANAKIISAELPNVTMKLCTYTKEETDLHLNVEKFPEENGYGFELNSSGYYGSNNQKQGSTYAMCKVKFEAPSDDFTLHIDVINFAESTYDYGLFSNIDTELTQTSTGDTDGVFKSFKGEQSAQVKSVDYTGISKGEHFICVKYVKDGSGDNDNDSVQFKIDASVISYKDITPIQTKQTGEGGGKVEFEKVPQNDYILIAEALGGEELWRRFIEYDGVSEMVCKSGKALEEYDLKDVKKARQGDYARYMWSVGDVAYLPSFMGSSDKTYTKCIVTTFDRARNADGSGDKLMGFIGAPTSASYKHREAYGSNGISWVGSLIRKNCLKSGEEQYVYDDTVSAETSGTYYKLNEDCKTFDEVTLPDAFDANTKYYTKEVMEEDGAFIAGLPEGVEELLEQVEVPTWSGAIGKSNTNKSDNTIIITKDKFWLPSDSEVFGDKVEDRYVNYSKVGLEGKTLDLYKEYKEKNFWLSGIVWLRSPYLTVAGNFCYWSNSGYVSNINAAGYTYRAALCFCI